MKECFHKFTLPLDGYFSVVCCKCGLSYEFINKRPAHIDAPNNKNNYDRWYSFSEYYDLKKENEILKKKLEQSLSGSADKSASPKLRSLCETCCNSCRSDVVITDCGMYEEA